MLYIATTIVIILALCRYVPGFKCVSYCNIKRNLYRRSMNKISKDVHKMETKELLSIEKYIRPWTCTKFDESEGERKLRDAVVQEVIDRELLE